MAENNIVYKLKEFEELKEKTINMFNFLHDVIRDLGEGNGESKNWAQAFTEEFSLYMAGIEKAGE